MSALPLFYRKEKMSYTNKNKGFKSGSVGVAVAAIVSVATIVGGMTALGFYLHDLSNGDVNSGNESNKDEDVTETKNLTYTTNIQYKTTTIDDSSMLAGTKKVKTAGVNGVRTTVYKVTYKNGKEISREVVSNTITKQPVDAVILVGTKKVVTWKCYDATSYDKNPYNDNRCVSSEGVTRYVSDSESGILDPSYTPGKSGNSYYNSF